MRSDFLKIIELWFDGGLFYDTICYRMVFFYLVSTGSIFDISLCNNSINHK